MSGRASSSSLRQEFTVPDEFEIPEGFCIATVGPNNHPVLIPSYMKQALVAQAMFDLERAKLESLGYERASSSRIPSAYQNAAIGETNGEIPLIPQSPSERELLGAHAEIEYIQQRLGLSYEDACDWLKQQELERLKRANEDMKFLEDMRHTLRNLVHSLGGSDELEVRGHADDPTTVGTEDVVEDIAEQPKTDRKGKGKARDIGY